MAKLKLDFSWKKHPKVYYISAGVLILVVVFAAGTYFGYQNRPAVEKVLQVAGQKPPAQFQNVDFNLFWNVWSQVEDKYVDRSQINRQDLVYGAVSGLVKALKDPYSEFLPPAQNKQFMEDVNGSFGGIGAEIGIKRDVITIIAPLKDSPAERAGIKTGDKILKIDDTSTADLALDEAVRRIRGPKGTEVRLTIMRASFDNPREFKITRDTISVPILETEKKDDGIFVIKLHNFTDTAPFEFRKAAEQFYNSGSTKLILDLRNDPGGYLSAAVDIASWFLPPGEIVARERLADGSEDVYRSAGYKLLQDVPTVILVNEGSASASEIVSGALRDVKGAKLVGTKTFGKGLVQEVIPLPEGASLKLTIAKWLTPKGEEINGKGLEPDIPVEVSPDAPADKDQIMEKGIEVLKGL